MAVLKKFSSGKRFGSRYGARLRHKVALIENESKKLHKCPACHAEKAKRMAVGIWKCIKCNAVFTSKAYTVSKKVVLREVPGIESEVIVESAEEEPESTEEETEEEEE